MQTCFYHANVESVAQCMGCKMPICAGCQSAGATAFCAACVKKVAALGSQIEDVKRTGMVQSAHKATMLKTATRPTSHKNVTYCFQHFDVIAAGLCPTCNRNFCQDCLDASGHCTHCARVAAPPPARPRSTTGRLPATVAEPARLPPPPMRAQPAPAAPSRLFAPSTFFVLAVVVFLLIVAYKVMA